MTEDYRGHYGKPSEPLTVSNPLDVIVSWDLCRMIKAIDSPSITVPENIKSHGGLLKWIKSLNNEDFK